MPHNTSQIASRSAEIGRIELPSPIDAAAVKRVTAEFPKVFRKQKPRPLQIGILGDFLAAGVPYKVICAALDRYTTTREYYVACRAGRKRYGIHGNPVGTVSVENQVYADERLAILDAISACKSA